MKGDNISDHIKSVRRNFNDAPLLRKDLLNNPIEQFKRWMSEAVEASLLDPFAMCLATVDAEGSPDTRIVYLREITEEGFIFYTNYESEKCQHIWNNANVSLNFLWNEVSRQVKIKGEASKADVHFSDKYFAERPRESQLGAWASAQSSVIKDRSVLERQWEKVEEKFKNKEVTRPPFWGGIIVKPRYFEFWKGRANRFHDRYIYDSDGMNWEIKTLSP